MNISTIISALFLSRTVLTTWLILAAIFVVVSIFLFLRLMFKREKEFEDKRDRVFADYDNILNKAHKDAEDILKRAGLEASQIRSEGTQTGAKIAGDLNEELKNFSKGQLTLFQRETKDFLDSYRNYLDSLNSTYRKQTELTLKDLESATQNEFTSLKSDIQKRILSGHDSVERQLQEEMAKTKIEIEDYKKHQLEAIKNSLDNIVLAVAEEVLGHAIPIIDHKQLVLDAFEKARKEGVFDI